MTRWLRAGFGAQCPPTAHPQGRGKSVSVELWVLTGKVASEPSGGCVNVLKVSVGRGSNLGKPIQQRRSDTAGNTASLHVTSAVIDFWTYRQTPPLNPHHIAAPAPPAQPKGLKRCWRIFPFLFQAGSSPGKYSPGLWGAAQHCPVLCDSVQQQLLFAPCLKAAALLTA